MTRRVVLAATFVLSLGLATRVWADPMVIDFEDFDELESITIQIPGMVWTNATVLTAGSTLNEFETPPHSGQNVVFDDGGPVVIKFLSPVLSFGAFLTYFEPVTLQAFDSLNALLGSVSSAFFTNLALSGDPGSIPNEFLQIVSSTGISLVMISGNADGGSFVLDDATIDVQVIPEPATLSLLSIGAAVGYASRRRQHRLRPYIVDN